MKRALLLFLLLVLPVTVHAQTSVIVRGKVSVANATTTPLSGGAVFTGGFEDARDYTTLTTTVFSDKASAVGGYEVQWSGDAVNVDVTDVYSVSANVGATWTVVTKARYYRCKYTNGAVTQTIFRMSAILRQSGSPGYAETDAGLSDAELRATPVPVSGTITANVGTGTQPVSGTITANVGTGTQPVSGTVTANVGTGTQPVSGTFWQATQPVSGTFWQTTQPVSGTFWQATQPVSGPLTDTQLRLTPVPVSGTFFQATQPVSGTVTANAGTGTLAVSGPVTDTQIRATPLPVSGTVTANAGTGTLAVSNAGLTNVDVALSTRLKPADTLTAVTTVGTITNPVAVTSAGLTNLDAALSTRLKPADTLAGVTTVATVTNLATIGTSVTPGTATANLGKAEDAAHASGDTGVLALAVRNQGAATLTSADGDNSGIGVDAYGAVYQAPHPGRFSCFLQAVTVTTQCFAAPAAGLRAYVTSVSASNQAATVQTLDIVFGTGANCVTGITALTHKWQMGTNATTTSPQDIEVSFPTPLVPTAANAICVRPSAATAFGVTITGFLAP